MNVFRHLKTGIRVAMNYKAMFTFFDSSDKFHREFSGSHLIDENRKVGVDLMIFRNPEKKIISFYNDKILNGEYVNLHKNFVKKAESIFGSRLNANYPSVSVDEFIENLDSLVLSEPHLFPQMFCLRWIRYKIPIRMERDLSILKVLFRDVDMSQKKNSTSQNTEMSEESSKKIRSIYRDDFLLMYPDLL